MTIAEKILYKHWNAWHKDVELDVDFVQQVILKSMEEYRKVSDIIIPLNELKRLENPVSVSQVSEFTPFMADLT